MVAAKWNPDSDCSASMSPDPIFSEAEVMDMLFRGIVPTRRIRGGGEGSSDGSDDDGDDDNDDDDAFDDDDDDDDNDDS